MYPPLLKNRVNIKCPRVSLCIANTPHPSTFNSTENGFNIRDTQSTFVNLVNTCIAFNLIIVSGVVIFWVNTQLVKKSFLEYLTALEKGLKNWWQSSWWCGVPFPQLHSSTSHLLSLPLPSYQKDKYAHKMEEAKQEAAQNGFAGSPCHCAPRMEDYEGSKRSSFTKCDA